MKPIQTKNLFFVIALILSLTILVSCKGGVKCGPGEDPLTDADSDCIEDSSDNCPLDYNPDQIDTDEDEAGVACDIDDSDETVGPDYDVSETSLTLATQYLSPEISANKTENPSLHNPECLYYLVGCGDQYLGTFENENDMARLFDGEGFFSKPHSSCSALDEFSKYPPMIFCDDGTLQDIFVGYLTSNPDIPHRIDTCLTLLEFGLNDSLCE